MIDIYTVDQRSRIVVNHAHTLHTAAEIDKGLAPTFFVGVFGLSVVLLEKTF